MEMIIDPAKSIITLSSLNKGLVGHWPLDLESLQSATVFADKTPYENVGTSVNVPVFTTDRMGQADRAMSFDGESDRINVGLITLGGEFTIGFWAKPNSAASYQSITDDNGEQYSKGAISVNAGLWCVREKDADGSKPLRSTSFDISSWQFVLFTQRGTTAKVYYNGDLENTDTAFDPISQINNIGWSDGVMEVGFDGSLADVRIYNRALSETEITTLYDAYRPKLVLSH